MHHITTHATYKYFTFSGYDGGVGWWLKYIMYVYECAKPFEGTDVFYRINLNYAK